jgi:hypothetical protein
MGLSTKMMLLAMGGARLAAAEITKPNANSLVHIDETFEITWDTEGLTAPLTIDLVPADSPDGTIVAQRIASKFLQKAQPLHSSNANTIIVSRH